MYLRLLFTGFGLLVFLIVQAELPELIPVRVGERFGYCDAGMNLKIPAQFQEAMPFENNRAVVKLGDQFGLIDPTGNWILEPEQDEIVIGRLLRLRKNGKYALADLDGCRLTEYSLTAIYELRNGYFLLDEQGRKGLANPEGRVLVPCLFEQVSQLRDDQSNYMDLFAVRMEGQLGLYNACGEACLRPMLQSIGIFQEGFAVVQKGRQFGMIDAEGNLRVPCEFEQLQGMSEGIVAAKLKTRWGFIDGTGREILPFLYEAVQDGGFFQGRVSVNRAGAWMILLRTGEVDFSLSANFQHAGALAEGLLPVCALSEERGLRFGYADVDGKLCIPMHYERAEPFYKGFAIVGKRVAGSESIIEEMRFGIIDRRGRTIVPILLHNQTEARLKRDSLGHLGFTTLSVRGRNCKVDQKGRRFGCENDPMGNLQRQFVSTNCERGRLVAVLQNDRWGFCDQRGKLIIPCEYLTVNCFSGGLARVWTGTNSASFHYIDEQGKAYILPAS